MTKSTFKDISFLEVLKESQLTVKLRDVWKLFLHLVIDRWNMPEFST